MLMAQDEKKKHTNIFYAWKKYFDIYGRMVLIVMMEILLSERVL